MQRNHVWSALISMRQNCLDTVVISATLHTVQLETREIESLTSLDASLIAEKHGVDSE